MGKNPWGIVLGILTTALGVLSISEGVKLGYRMNLDESGVGFFPMVVGVGLLLCGLYQLAFAHMLKIACKPVGPKEQRVVASVFFSLVAYAGLVHYVGYPEATLLFILFLTRLLGNRSWAYSIGAAVTTAAVFTLVFKIWMQMPLPSLVLTALGVN